ncbi:MAG: ABC-F family ATP-binding cassette domain-containing protein [Adhaeribacter sp.]
MLTLQNISYTHPNQDLLFANLNLVLNPYTKAALIGNNGVGKSTLLKIMAGELAPASGQVKAGSEPFYVPQLFGQYNDLTLAQALQVESKLRSLQQILAGEVSEENLGLLDDDWTIEERCQQALGYWKLKNADLGQKMGTLSGGEKTKVFLAGISIHQPDLVLLDEPSNHLDAAGRQLLYHFVQSFPGTLLAVSHDRTLLNLLGSVYELHKRGISLYGGNYEFYHEQKRLESNALHEELKDKEKALRKARQTARETLERQQKLDARGKKKQENAGLPTIMMNTLRNQAEKSTSRLKGVHAEKVGAISQELTGLRKELPDADKIKFGFDHSRLHQGKILFRAQDLNHGYGQHLLWQQALQLQIASGERIALTGLNGSGKTTLIKIILGELQALQGRVYRADNQAVYVDQDYSLIDNQRSIYQQARHFNLSALQEHEIKIRLARFLFSSGDWDKPCSTLSGGEKMRLLLCCLTLSSQAPDLIILDEPTNNLDLQNIGILTAAVNEYQGTLLLVSHDSYFLKQVNIQRIIHLE